MRYVLAVLIMLSGCWMCDGSNMEACKKMCAPRVVQSYNGGTCVCAIGQTAEETKK